MKTCFRDATVVLHRGDQPVVLEHHSIVVDDALVANVSPVADIDRLVASAPPDLTIDAARHIIIPGLINTHHHLFQSLTRCLKPVQTAPLFDWLTQLYQRWQHLDYETHKLAAQVSIAELLLGGCTTTSDHHYLFPPARDIRLEAVLEAADELGIRIHACRGSMSVGQSKGGLPPDACAEDERRVLADCERVLDRFHDPRPGSLRRIDLAPCAPFNVSAELLVDTAMLARQRGVLLHTHAAETLDEERYCLDRFGCRPIEYLRRHHWLGPDVYLAHCVHLNADEIDLLARTRTAVAHCPSSNMRLGSGPPPIRDMLDRGVVVGLGVDGSSSNDGGSLTVEMRQSLLLQRVVRGADAMTPAEAFSMATRGGAAVLGRSELGNIEPGCPADLVFYRADDIALAGAVAHDPLAALVLCQPPRPERVLVHGRTVVADGRLTRVDAAALADRFNAVARRFR